MSGVCPGGRWIGWLALPAACWLGPASALRATEGPSKVDYNREVRPILAKNCFACHGPDEEKRARDLRLDVRESAVRELEDGERAIVPGDPDSSCLIERITDEDETMRMPPRKQGPRLSKTEIAILTRWVREGASYAQHWAFALPVKVAPPETVHVAWARNPIDRFIAARLERAGLKPSPEADRLTLLRRISFDLRGLPPTLEEMEQVSNDTHPDWYERLVDRFLADPSYGERWARVWLDLARYADSAGYGSDPLRFNIWPYRDWVIEAFNRNLPYDQFSTLQLAGDLLPHPGYAQRAATAFHRNTMTNTEGGTDDEEWRVAAVKDRVDTTMQIWMGLTAGCAKCHSHKFDPITQEEYYRLFAFFNQSADADKGDESPTIPAEPWDLMARMRVIDRELLPLRKQLECAPIDPRAFERWLDLVADRNTPVRRGVPGDVLAKIDLPAPRRTVEQAKAIEAYYRRSVAPELRLLSEQAARLEELRPVVPNLPVMVELEESKRRVTHVLRKGNYLDPGPVVEAGVPRAFHRWPAGAPMNRLGLAQWLFDRRNPLTARVAVNRFWARLFGLGLVETEEDFGVQGEPPSHPELLDWLAVEYRESGWDTKGLLRLITTSATYRQAARTTVHQLKLDPRNRLLARFPRVRLEAEMVRDQALALGGMLYRKLGGPSVFPPQPEGLWQAAFNGERTWRVSPGVEGRRRGVYVFLRRTVPYPSMAAFDAPSREICAIKRVASNTPLQAFVTLNDPVYVEAARGLAGRLLGAGDSPREQIAWGLRICLCRNPRAEQIDWLLELYEAELRRYRNDAQAAARLAGPLAAGSKGSPAEYAAWTTIASVLLNLDAVLTRG